MSSTSPDYDHKIGSLWDEVLNKLEDIRSRAGVEDTDPEFRKSVTSWFGDDGYDSYLEWCNEDAE